MKRVIFSILFIGLWFVSFGQLSERQRIVVDSMMNAGVTKGYYPGATVIVGERNCVLFEGYYGYTDETKNTPVTAKHLYDIASCTKIVATTLSVMTLYEQGKIELNAPIDAYLDAFSGAPAGKLTISELLTHTSGLPQLFVHSMFKNTHFKRHYLSTHAKEGYRYFAPNIYVNPDVDSEVVRRIIMGYKPEDRSKYTYCDSNFQVLKLIVEQVSGEPFERYTQKLYTRLSMHATGFLPLERTTIECIVPTETDLLMGRGIVQGDTHDELAVICGNVAGHAGVFSNVRDLSNYCHMMLNEGELNGEQIVSKATIDQFTKMPLRNKGIFRAYGFDRRGPKSMLAKGYGHTGFTGTIIWIDPATERYMVFLSNRVSPTRENKGLQTSMLREKMWNVVNTSR